MDPRRQWPNPPAKRQRRETRPDASHSIPVNEGNWTHQNHYGFDSSLSGLGLNLAAGCHAPELGNQQPSFASHASSHTNARVADPLNPPGRENTAFRHILPNPEANFMSPEISSYTGQAWQFPHQGPQQYLRPITPVQGLFGSGLAYIPSFPCNDPLFVRLVEDEATPQVQLERPKQKTNRSLTPSLPVPLFHDGVNERKYLRDTVCFGMVRSPSLFFSHFLSFIFLFFFRSQD